MGSGERLEPTWVLEPVLLFLHARPPTAAPAVAGCHLGQVGFAPGNKIRKTMGDRLMPKPLGKNTMKRLAKTVKQWKH